MRRSTLCAVRALRLDVTGEILVGPSPPPAGLDPAAALRFVVLRQRDPGGS